MSRRPSDRPLSRTSFECLTSPIARCAAALVLGLLLSGPASATFIDSSIALGSRYPDTSAIPVDFGSAIVGPGVEFPMIFGTVWTSDISATTIQLDQNATGNLLGPADFNGFVYVFTGASAIASVTVDSSSTLVPTSVSATSNSIFINYAGLGRVGPSSTLLNVAFVPEPTTAALLGLGLCALASRRPRP